MDRNDLIDVELVFASAEQQVLLKTKVVDGITAREAINRSELAAKFPDFDFAQCPLGIWGRAVADTQPVRQGDRVEAYRQLLRDPRDARRELALAGRSMGR